MKKIIENILTSKTFGYLILVFIIATLALFLGKLSGEIWVQLIQWLSGYATIRGTAEQLNKIKEKKNEIENNIHNRTDSELAADIVARTER